MKDMSLVSIIMPLYNAEKYLRNSINSILNQTYCNIELILVNDGSTDNSQLICDEYAKNDYRIKVIHQENSGPSVARNKGIDGANGRYIQFVDSDDSVEPNMTNKLVESINKNVQLAICGYNSIEVDNGKNTVIRKNPMIIEGIYSIHEFVQYFGEYHKNGLINPLWNKLYVAEKINKFNIRFIGGLNMGEDLLFNLEYIDVCSNISITNDALYNYLTVNTNSLTGSFKSEFFENQQILFQKVRGFLLEYNIYKEKNKEFVEINYTNSIVGCFGNLFHKDSNLTSRYIKEQISNIVFDECVRKNILYFKEGNIQKKIIGYFIKFKSINGIYWFYKSKNTLRYRLKPIFGLLKGLNSGVTY